MRIIIELAGAAVLCTVIGVGTYRLLDWIREVKFISEREDEHEKD